MGKNTAGGKENKHFPLNKSCLIFVFSGVSISLLEGPANHFIGCMADVEFFSGNTPLDTPLYDKTDVELGCTSQCDTDNPCIHGGQCINHYTHTTCDCFGTRYEGKHCDKKGKNEILLIPGGEIEGRSLF